MGAALGSAIDVRTVLANRLDMAVRSAMTGEGGNPRAVYFPEPNLLVEMTGRRVRGSFGSSVNDREARRLLRSLTPPPTDVLFDIEGALVTAAPIRAEAVPDGDVVIGTWARFSVVTAETLSSIVNAAQSHASPSAWHENLKAQYGLRYRLSSAGPVLQYFSPLYSKESGENSYSPEFLRERVRTAVPDVDDLPKALLDALVEELETTHRGRPGFAAQGRSAQDIAAEIVRLARLTGAATRQVLLTILLPMEPLRPRGVSAFGRCTPRAGRGASSLRAP